MKLTLDDIREVIDSVVDRDKFLYSLDVTTPPKHYIHQREQDNLIPDSEDLYNTSPHLNSGVKSIIVWSIFTKVAADYFFRDEYLFQILNALNKKYKDTDVNFSWDDYVFNRKQFAVQSGAGKISKPSLVFSKDFGLNVKYELIFTSAVFDEVQTLSDDILYENCDGCDAPCQTKCPQGCRMDYDLIDWKKCSNFVESAYLFENPELMCRVCIESCPYSNEILSSIDSKYGHYMPERYKNLNHD